MSLDNSMWPCVHNVFRTKTLSLSLRQIKRKTSKSCNYSCLYTRGEIYDTPAWPWLCADLGSGWGLGVRIPPREFLIGVWWLYIGIESIFYTCGLGLLWLHALCNLEKQKETQKCVKNYTATDWEPVSYEALLDNPWICFRFYFLVLIFYRLHHEIRY